MKLTAFASRNSKEILRDPLNLAFGIGFPLILLFLLQAIQSNVPVNLFEVESLVPGLVVFGFSFIALFSSILISKDRSTSFLVRLFAAPLSAFDFIMGYVLPLIPLAIAQSAICFLTALGFGLQLSVNILVTIVVLLPAAVLFIGIGLWAGSVLNDKQVGGVCGALLTNLSAWLSGTWFDLNLVGGWFKKIAYLLPFAHAVDAGRAALRGDYAAIFPDLWWVIGYAAAIMAFAVFTFKRKMNSDKV